MIGQYFIEKTSNETWFAKEVIGQVIFDIKTFFSVSEPFIADLLSSGTLNYMSLSRLD